MATSSIDRRTFLANLRQSGLVSDELLTELTDRLPETNRGRVLARALVEQGVLTKFQAERLLAGRTSGFLLGQYRILDQLGQGGMGRVFKAVHQTMHRVVALKVLAPQLIETEKAQQLFLREMRAVAQLNHPNLVTAYDANQVGNRHYLVLEYVDGPNLCQLVRDQGPLPVGLACELMRQAAEGLQYAHEMGMVHRDIKPSNLLVSPPSTGAWRKKCTLKILDFGLARFQSFNDLNGQGQASIVTEGNIVLGTPDFVSPEQARSLHAVDIRSDLYSLGCTFYYLLTGQVTFPGGTSMEKIIRHSIEEAVPVERLRPDIPAGVSAVVRRLMAKHANERYQTPAELAKVLRPFAVEEAASLSLTEPVRVDEDVLATPASRIEDSFVAGAQTEEQPACQEDLAALMGTMPMHESATPFSSAKLVMPAKGTSAAADEHQRIWLAVGIAVGIVGGLLGLASLLLLL
jgi:serine/threonine protein kinase